MITNSTYIEGPTQADGRRWVYETHFTTEDGDLKYEWLGTQDAQMVLEERVKILNKQYAKRDEAKALVAGSLIPMTKLEFRNLFGSSKPAIDAFNAGFESSPMLSTEQKAAIRTGLQDFAEAKYIERLFRSDVVQLINLYLTLGLINSTQVSKIMEVGNGG